MASEELMKLYIELQRLARQMHRFAYKAMHEGNHYRGAQSRLLTVVAENDGITQRELAEILDVRPSSLTAMVGKMEQFELIKRKQDEKDQRVMHIYITDKGKEIEVKSKDDIQKLADLLFENLSEEEIKNMLAIIEKLSHTFNSYDIGDLQFGFHGYHGYHECHRFHGYHHGIEDNF